MQKFVDDESDCAIFMDEYLRSQGWFEVALRLQDRPFFALGRCQVGA